MIKKIICFLMILVFGIGGAFAISVEKAENGERIIAVWQDTGLYSYTSEDRNTVRFYLRKNNDGAETALTFSDEIRQLILMEVAISQKKFGIEPDMEKLGQFSTEKLISLYTSVNGSFIHSIKECTGGCAVIFNTSIGYLSVDMGSGNVTLIGNRSFALTETGKVVFYDPNEMTVNGKSIPFPREWNINGICALGVRDDGSGIVICACDNLAERVSKVYAYTFGKDDAEKVYEVGQMPFSGKPDRVLCGGDGYYMFYSQNNAAYGSVYLLDPSTDKVSALCIKKSWLSFKATLGDTEDQLLPLGVFSDGGFVLYDITQDRILKLDASEMSVSSLGSGGEIGKKTGMDTRQLSALIYKAFLSSDRLILSGGDASMIIDLQ